MVGIVWMVGMVCKSVGYGMFDMTVCMGLYGMYGYYDGGQKCCKDPANTRLDLRNAANSLQIDLKGRGCYLGTHTMGG